MVVHRGVRFRLRPDRPGHHGDDFRCGRGPGAGQPVAWLVSTTLAIWVIQALCAFCLEDAVRGLVKS